MAIDWEGMYSEQSREMFRIISAGRYTLEQGFYFGYAFSMFHFAGSKLNENVTDNLLVNPYAGWGFNAFFDFDIKAGFLFAPQRGRSVDHNWKKPCGAQIDFVLTKWGVKLENNLYLGENLQPLRNIAVGEDIPLPTDRTDCTPANRSMPRRSTSTTARGSATTADSSRARWPSRRAWCSTTTARAWAPSRS
ncbi:MAG: hypothetical protein ACLUQ6_01450 [Alistipes onderdonkii]